MAKEVITRDQQEEKYTWNVKDLYEDKSAYDKDVEFVKEKVEETTKYEGRVCESADTLYEVLELYRIIGEKVNRVFEYAGRVFDVDQGNPEGRSMYMQIIGLSSEISSKTAFVDPEIIACDDEKIEAFFKEKPELELYRIMIKETRRLKPHTLSVEVEKAVALASEIAFVPKDVYSTFMNVDSTYPAVKDENGEETVITDGRFVRLLESANRQVREDTFKAYYSQIRHYINTLASTFSGEVKTHIFNARLRGYKTTLEAAVDHNNVSPEVYKNLIDTVDKNLNVLHRYVSLRKKCLKVDELHMYDVYTSIIPDTARKVPYEEAKETVVKALAVLGDDYVSVVKEAFANRWIDVYENKGKRGGAYSAGVYGCHPYMLLNYGDSLDDMFTLIHEMGHSMHTYYTCKNQPSIYSDYKIFVAEVASTTNELLLLDYLLKNTEDKKERAYLLNHFVDSFKQTVYRQTMFAEFEMRSNAMAEAGEDLSAEKLCALYKEINEKYYGPDMISDDEIAYEWARIAHFYMNFYVYQYATSFCAAVDISERILKEGAPMVEQYKKFLSSGCTDAPVELLKIAGVDLSTPAPIEAALKKCGALLDELETLTD